MSKSEKKGNKTGNGKQTVDGIPQKKGKQGKTPRELMTDHLKNKGHVISNEDFENLNIDVEETGTSELKIDNSQERPHDEDKDHAITTPWDVIK